MSRRITREGSFFYEWMTHYNSTKELHKVKQKILKLCIEGRKREIKYSGSVSSYFLLNSYISIPKPVMMKWLKSGSSITLYVHIDGGIISINMDSINKIT